MGDGRLKNNTIKTFARLHCESAGRERDFHLNSISTSHACVAGAAVLTLLQDSRVHGVPAASTVGVHTELLRNAHLGSKQIPC